MQDPLGMFQQESEKSKFIFIKIIVTAMKKKNGPNGHWQPCKKVIAVVQMNSREAQRGQGYRKLLRWDDNLSYVGESREEGIKKDPEVFGFRYWVVGEAISQEMNHM